MLAIWAIDKISTDMCLRYRHLFIHIRTEVHTRNKFGVISKYMVGKATNLDMVKQKQHIGGKREMGHG